MLLWTISSYYFVFLFKYDAVIIKQPSSCFFGKKTCKILEKNHHCQVPLMNFKNVGGLGELDNVEYGNNGDDEDFYKKIILDF